MDDLQMSMDDQPVVHQTDEYATLTTFDFVAVTKPATILTNPSNKLTSVSGYNFSSR